MAKFNVLFVAIDTLRADHLGCYGYFRATSPNIDRLAGDGVLFSETFAPGIPTHPGYTTMFTGVHPLVHQIVCHAGSVSLDWSIPLLSEILKREGYVTGAVDNLGRRAPWFVRGYDFYIYPKSRAAPSGGAKVDAKEVTGLAGKWMEDWVKGKMEGDAFFLFLHYWDPHTPYIPPSSCLEPFYKGDPRNPTNKSMEELKETPWGKRILENWRWLSGITDMEYVKALYDGEILSVDKQIGLLMEVLDELSLADNTLFVLTSDHGELLNEHHIYFDHHGLYDPDVHVPLIMRGVDALPKGLKVRSMVQHINIVPTLLDLLGIEKPAHIEGRSLLSMTRGEWKGHQEIILVENTRMTKRALRTRQWKLIETLRPDYFGNPAGYLELYNLREDPEEETNLAEEEAGISDQLLGRLERTYRRMVGGRSDPLMAQDISLKIQ